MIFVWVKSCIGVTAFKCDELPTDGGNKPIATLAIHQLPADETDLQISVLAKLYPAPKESKS